MTTPQDPPVTFRAGAAAGEDIPAALPRPWHRAPPPAPWC